jgi:hypothetical protein
MRLDLDSFDFDLVMVAMFIAGPLVGFIALGKCWF